MSKKERKEQAPTCEAYIERIKVLEKDIEAYRKDGEKMGEEILALRRSIASYKSQNTLLRKKLDEVSHEASLHESLAIQFDNLKAECDSLRLSLVNTKKQHEEYAADKEKVIMGCNERFNKIALEKSELENKLAAAKETEEELYRTIEELCTPWYKKLF